MIQSRGGSRGKNGEGDLQWNLIVKAGGAYSQVLLITNLVINLYRSSCKATVTQWPTVDTMAYG